MDLNFTWLIRSSNSTFKNNMIKYPENDYSDSEEENLEFPSYIKYITTGICIILLIIGIVGNMLVPIIVCLNKELRNSTNYFLVNLSVADLLIMIICMPTVLTELHSLPEVWILGEMMCKLVPFTEMMVAHGSILTILAITFERYYAICRPLMAGYTCTKMRALAIIFVIWIVATSITCPILLITEYKYTTYIDGTEVPVCITFAQSIWQKIYFFGVTVFLFFVPLLILIVIYSIIAKRLVESQRVLASPVADSQIKARKQVIFMLAAVVICFFLCLMPFRIFTMWLLIAPEYQLEDLGMETYYNLLYFCRIMLYINSAINPILYNVISSRFRDAFIRLFSCKNNKSLNRQFTLTSYTTFTVYSSLKTKQKVCLSLNGITHVDNNKKDETLV